MQGAVDYQGSTYALRVHGRQVVVRGAVFHIGRHPACDLVLKDGMVSRHHAVVRRHGDALYIEDAGSRNGVFVNGERVRYPVPLRPGDRIRIASFEIIVVEVSDEQRRRRTTQPRLSRPPAERPSKEPLSVASFAEVSHYDALLHSAQRHVQLGQFERLKGLARNLRAGIRGGLVEHQPPSELSVHQMGDFALTLAERYGITEWLDAYLELAGMARRPPLPEHVQRLRALMARGRGPDPEALQACARRLQAVADSMQDSERRALGELLALYGRPLPGVVHLR